MSQEVDNIVRIHQGRKSSDAGISVWQRDGSRCPIAALRLRTGRLRYRYWKFKAAIATATANLDKNCSSRRELRHLRQIPETLSNTVGVPHVVQPMRRPCR